MAGVNPTIWIITETWNGLKNPIKRQQLSGWIKCENPNTCCLQEILFIFKATNRSKILKTEKHKTSIQHL